MSDHTRLTARLLSHIITFSSMAYNHTTIYYAGHPEWKLKHMLAPLEF